ncbi:hypothetical protein E1286_06380 [Nonomuraea terrae]|uniref:Uncharacterized protein n=1 Tax=Nonomuraea terrae TaxID=2530383 RepID=A0A4R4Z8U9_9ACTN|nr:hypothetical protein [Nonomuraea terrae]TDD54120.1 hypothetical protein E1286_06380 [Nonomuraea terrae]
MPGMIRGGTPALRRAAYVGAALVAAVLVAMICGERLRFAHSAADMEAVARTLGEGVELRGRSIGSLTFEFVRREDDLVYFHRGEQGWDGDSYGYVWSPEHRPSDTRHLRGPWYRYWNDAHQ